VGHREDQVIERKAGGTPQGAASSVAFQGSFCGRLEWSWQVGCAALAPITLGQIMEIGCKLPLV